MFRTARMAPTCAPLGRRARRRSSSAIARVAGPRPAPVPARVRPHLARPRRRPRRRDRLDRPGQARVHRRVGAVHPRRRPDHDLRVVTSIALATLSRSSARSAGCRGSRPSTAPRRSTCRSSGARRCSSSSRSSTSPCPSSGSSCRASRAGSSALAFNYGAYMTEIFRAGIQAVPRGQSEAAEALGMPERRTCAGSSCRRRCGSSSRPSATTSSR